MLGMVASYGFLRLPSCLIRSIERYATKASAALFTASHTARFPNPCSMIDFTPPSHLQALSFPVQRGKQNALLSLSSKSGRES